MRALLQKRHQQKFKSRNVLSAQCLAAVEGGRPREKREEERRVKSEEKREKKKERIEKR